MKGQAPDQSPLSLGIMAYLRLHPEGVAGARVSEVFASWTADGEAVKQALIRLVHEPFLGVRRGSVGLAGEEWQQSVEERLGRLELAVETAGESRRASGESDDARPDELLTVQQAAAEAGVSENFIYGLCQPAENPRLPHFRVGGIKIKRADLSGYFQSQRREPKSAQGITSSPPTARRSSSRPLLKLDGSGLRPERLSPRRPEDGR